MENTSLINLSRQTVLRRQMDIIANNLANMNTTGYKAESVTFDQYVMPKASANNFANKADQPLNFVIDDDSHIDTSVGQHELTGNTFDVAIEGSGWFQVQTPDGPMYTRNGSFTLDDQGQLTTHSGYPVLSNGGAIQIDSGAKNIKITSDGLIVAQTESDDDDGDDDGGQEIGQLTVYDFENEQSLKRVGSQLYEGENPIAKADARLVQGMIENSNVKPVSEMTQMIEVSRAYEELSNLMKRQEDLRKNAIQQLGQLT